MDEKKNYYVFLLFLTTMYVITKLAKTIKETDKKNCVIAGTKLAIHPLTRDLYNLRKWVFLDGAEGPEGRVGENQRE